MEKLKEHIIGVYIDTALRITTENGGLNCINILLNVFL